jgi:ubiquinone/menaquinone biosynthesis C-methylase UbiE
MTGMVFEYVGCALCGAQDTDLVVRTTDLHYGVPGEFTAVRCRSCGLVYQDPRPTSSALPSAYPARYAPHQGVGSECGVFAPEASTWKEGVKERVANMFYSGQRALNFWQRRLFSPFYVYARVLRVILLPKGQGQGRRVLDVGCGTGRFLSEMQCCGWEVQGCEPRQEAALKAESALGKPILRSAFAPGLFKASSFDLVTMWHVLEHLPRPLQALKEVHRILKPAGWLVAMVPNIASLEFRVFRQAWFPLEMPRHLYHFSPSTLVQMLVKAGLSVYHIAFQIEPATREASARYLASSSVAVRAIQWFTQRRALLWLCSACLAWSHQSGTLVVYATKSV